jgi:hypothetical protein
VYRILDNNNGISIGARTQTQTLSVVNWLSFWQTQPEMRGPRVMVGIRQKLGLCLVLLMMCAVFFALGYWTRVLREGAGRYDFRARPETPANVSGSGSQPEAVGQRDKPTQRLS